MEDRRVPGLRGSLLTLFGLGYLPAGATLASLVGAGVWLALARAGASGMLSLLVFLVVLALSLVALAVTKLGEDRREVVVDEFLGMYAALLFLPRPDPWAMGALFVAFRVLDILKVPPFSWIDRWRTPAAILLDDVAIGLCLGLVYAGIVRALPA